MKVFTETDRDFGVGDIVLISHHLIKRQIGKIIEFDADDMKYPYFVRLADGQEMWFKANDLKDLTLMGKALYE